jgi:hypothetical protein
MEHETSNQMDRRAIPAGTKVVPSHRRQPAAPDSVLSSVAYYACQIRHAFSLRRSEETTAAQTGESQHSGILQQICPVCGFTITPDDKGLGLLSEGSGLGSLTPATVLHNIRYLQRATVSFRLIFRF